MSTITKTAFANLKQNESRNILVGIAVFLTTLLLAIVPNVGVATINLEFAAVNRVLPTFHVMYREAGEEEAQTLKRHEEVECAGLRADAGEIVLPDGTALLTYMDEEALSLQKITLEEGRFPEKENEIVLQEGLLKELGVQAGIGDTVTLPYQIYEEGGMSYEQTAEFLIVGFEQTTEYSVKKKMFGCLVSQSFYDSHVPKEEREYRVVLRLAEADHMNADDIEMRAKALGEAYGILPANIVMNREYIVANYADPELYMGVAWIMLIIVIAGVITIYSIYYVSMITKVQEFGRLRAIGATKRQIRRIVLQEGMLVAGIAIPAGALLGTVSVPFCVRMLYGRIDNTDAMTKTVKALLRGGKVPMINGWLVLLAAAVSILTVYLSLIRPMRLASKISAVEAMRYDGNQNPKKKIRKGYETISVRKLTGINLGRNKKRTITTIVTLSVTGIFYVIISTILSCADPKQMTKENMQESFRIEIESWEEDKANPQRSWKVIQKNNPFTEALKEEILAIDGVESIEMKSRLEAKEADLKIGGEEVLLHVGGLDDSHSKEIEEGLIEGDVTWEELKAAGGSKVIAAVPSYFSLNYPVKVGDKFDLVYFDGEKEVTKNVEVAGIGEYTRGVIENTFIMPKETVDGLVTSDLSYTMEIKTDPEKYSAVESALQSIVEEQELFELESYRDLLKENETSVQFLSILCYTFIGILSAIGILNLINTMINSIYIRKKELGILQAIGLSDRQMIQMLRLESMVYTVGTLLLSVTIGGGAGYAAFQYAKNNGLYVGNVYHYPFVQTGILIVVILAIQLALTYAVNKNFKKQNLIDRIRFSE